MKVDQKINSMLMSFPFIKKIVKRFYQVINVILKKPKKYEGNIECVSPQDNFDYFFGYYDKSPWDISNRYMLCMKTKDTSKNVAPNEKLEILLIDTENNNKVEKIAESHAWNVQQGCMAQWLGPDYNQNIRNNKYCSVILNIKTKKERIIDFPIYSVSSDGKFAFSLDFSRLHRLRPGYGYSNLEDTTKGEKIPNSTCIWKIDLLENKIIPFLKYNDFYNFEQRSEMNGAVHKVNHIMISPNNDKFMVIHRWLKGNKKYSRLVTCDIKNKKLFNLSDDNMVSHCYWKNNNEIIGFLNKKTKGNGYYLLNDKTLDYKQIMSSLINDGHPSFSPNGEYILTDSYPNKNRLQTINIAFNGQISCIAKVFSPFKYDNNTRCDLHPRWSRDSKNICFDGCFEKKRRLYVISNIHHYIPHKILSNYDISFKKNNGLVSCIIPTYKRCDMIERAIDSVLNQTYKNIEVIVVNDNVPNDVYSKELQKLMLKYKGNANVKLVSQEEHINGAVARNVGIREAKGEYIAFLDDDDEWLPTKIEKQIKLFRKSETGVVTCLWGAYKNNKLIKKCQIYNEKDMTFKILSRKVSIFTSTVIMRKDVAIQFGGFDETLKRHQDLQFLTDASDNTRFAILAEYLTKLHVDSDINRPNLYNFIDSKKKFLKCEKKKIDGYNFINRARIYGAHNFEIIFSALKEKNIKIIIKYSLKVFINIFAIYDVIIRYLKRKSSIKLKNRRG